MKESEKSSKKESEAVKINMSIDMEEQCYICPDCGHVVYWVKEDKD